MPATGPGKRERFSRSTVAVVGVSVAVFAVHGWLFYGHVVDDAYITFRYADNVASGHGVVWNRGESPVEGYTNFSWMLLAALVRLVGFAPDRAMLAIGFVAGLAAVGACAVGARSFVPTESDGDRPRLGGAVAGLVAATFTGHALYATTGLETPLHALLFTCAALALVHRRALVFGLLVGAAFLTRPEAGLLGLTGVAFFALSPRRPEARVRDTLITAGAMAAIVLPYLAFKLATFGTILPNTLGAKEPSISRGLEYLIDDGWPAAALVVATFIGARVERRREARELGLLAAIFAVAVVFEGGDWMPASRMLVPIALWLAIASDATVLRWLRLRRPRALSVAGLLLLVPWLGVNATWSASLLSTGPDIERMNDARRALFARLHEQGVRSMALVDIGLPGYLLPAVRITDLGGLVDREIGQSPGGHLSKHPHVAYLEARGDEIYVLTTFGEEGDGPPSPRDFKFEVERYVAATEWFRTHYRLRERIDGFRDNGTYVYERVD
jgi:hypothetical protein